MVKTLLINAGSTRDSGSINAGSTGDSGSNSGLGKSHGVESDNPLQDSCLENSTNRGTW